MYTYTCTYTPYSDTILRTRFTSGDSAETEQGSKVFFFKISIIKIFLQQENIHVLCIYLF